MTAQQQVNAIASAVHVLKTLARVECADATKEEETLRVTTLGLAIIMSDALDLHFDMGAMTQEEWDKIPIESAEEEV